LSTRARRMGLFWPFPLLMRNDDAHQLLSPGRVGAFLPPDPRRTPFHANVVDNLGFRRALSSINLPLERKHRPGADPCPGGLVTVAAERNFAGRQGGGGVVSFAAVWRSAAWFPSLTPLTIPGMWDTNQLKEMLAPTCRLPSNVKLNLGPFAGLGPKRMVCVAFPPCDCPPAQASDHGPLAPCPRHGQLLGPSPGGQAQSRPIGRGPRLGRFWAHMFRRGAPPPGN